MNTAVNLLADFLEQDETAAELKVCSRTLDRWQRLGEGPPITRLGRRVLYRRSSLLEWLRAREGQQGRHHRAQEAEQTPCAINTEQTATRFKPRRHR